MARYIDADKLLRKSFRIEGHFDLPSGKAQNFSAICDTEIINFPTADVVPVIHGHWIRVSDDDQDEGMYFCSECKKEQFLFADFALPNYCCYCGAKMDGDKNE